MTAAEAPNELRRRLLARDPPPSPSGAASSPSAEAAAPSEKPASAAAAAPAEAAAAAEEEVVVDGRGQLPGSRSWWRLLCLIASMCSRSWTQFPLPQLRFPCEGWVAAANRLPMHWWLRPAFDEARSQQKPLVVYLDDVGPLAEAACRDVLCNPVFIDVLLPMRYQQQQLQELQRQQQQGVEGHRGAARSAEGDWRVSAAASAGVAIAAAANARLLLPCLVFFLPSPALSRNPPRDPQLRWQSLAPRCSSISSTNRFAAAPAASAATAEHLSVSERFAVSAGSWGEADVLAEAMGAVDKYYQDKDECNRKEEEAKQNQLKTSSSSSCSSASISSGQQGAADCRCLCELRSLMKQQEDAFEEIQRHESLRCLQ
ncbi:hypothetical protein ACSSS7_006303 [Eimeria intestinalis]